MTLTLTTPDLRALALRLLGHPERLRLIHVRLDADTLTAELEGGREVRFRQLTYAELTERFPRYAADVHRAYLCAERGRLYCFLLDGQGLIDYPATETGQREVLERALSASPQSRG